MHTLKFKTQKCSSELFVQNYNCRSLTLNDVCLYTPHTWLLKCICFHSSGSVLVYMIDTTTGSMQLSHKLELTPKHYPGITHMLTSLSSSHCVISLHKFLAEITCIPSAVPLLGAHTVFPLVHICFSQSPLTSPKATAPPSGGTAIWARHHFKNPSEMSLE